jgi:hypothetical protein
MIGQLLVTIASIWQSRLVQAALAALVLPVTATTLHATQISHDLDVSTVYSGLEQAGLWIALGAAAAAGGMGGIVAELLSLHGHIELPHRVKPRRGVKRRTHLGDPEHEIDLGIISRVLLGATAALALLALDAPGNPTALLVNSLIAGSAATGVFRLVQGRMLGKSQPSATDKPTRPARATLSVVPSVPSQAAAAQ